MKRNGQTRACRESCLDGFIPLLQRAQKMPAYGKAGSGAGTPGASGVRAVLSNIATIV